MFKQCDNCGNVVLDGDRSGYTVDLDGIEAFICRSCDVAEGKIESWQVITRAPLS